MCHHVVAKTKLLKYFVWMMVCESFFVAGLQKTLFTIAKWLFIVAEWLF